MLARANNESVSNAANQDSEQENAIFEDALSPTILDRVVFKICKEPLTRLKRRQRINGRAI